ncbi:MAG: EamA family transporter RarD [Candidatus Symbiobacter sp.]|nr:EamA family transporter RarD [Candidatus Symbiobacter sp.]
MPEENAGALIAPDPVRSSDATRAPSAEKDLRRGVVIAMLSYMTWGFVPIYFKQLTDVAAALVVSQRAIWVAVFLLIGMAVTRRTPIFRAVLRDRRTFGLLVLSGMLLASNWAGFFYAVSTDRILDSSLAYFITPLMAVLFGTVILREKLRRWQWVAVAVATLGVMITVFGHGGGIGILPVFLALSWACYGMVRKFTNVDGFTGLLVESVVMAPMGLAISLYLEMAGWVRLAELSIIDWALLVNTATITIFPLIGFGIATRILSLSLLGLMNYISPMIQFLVAVSLFGEKLSWIRLSSFAVIWFSLVIIALENWHHTRHKKQAMAAAAAA